jgi:hypothetical protein
MLMSGLTFGITEGTGLGKVSSSMKPMERFRAMGERGLINTGVRLSLTGEKVEHVFKQELGSTMLAMGQSVVGDIGEKLSRRTESVIQRSPQGDVGIQKNAKTGSLRFAQDDGFFREGSLGKSLLHGTLGGMYSQVTSGKFATGFLGGGMGEVLAPITESSGVTKLMSSSVMLGLGGDVRDIQTVGQVSGSVVENNNLLHALRNVGIALFGISKEEAMILGSVAATGVTVQTVSNMESEPSVPSILSTPLPEQSKPKVLSTPIHEREVSIFSTPVSDQPSWSIVSTPEHTYQPWQTLPGFIPEQGEDMSVLYKYSPTDVPVRIEGKWSNNDLRRGLKGKNPIGLGTPDLHHADQMPGSAIHEILPGIHRGSKALHPNKYNQGVTSKMREQDRQLHWWYRAREEGAGEVFPDLIYDKNITNDK